MGLRDFALIETHQDMVSPPAGFGAVQLMLSTSCRVWGCSTDAETDGVSGLDQFDVIVGPLLWKEGV